MGRVHGLQKCHTGVKNITCEHGPWTLVSKFDTCVHVPWTRPVNTGIVCTGLYTCATYRVISRFDSARRCPILGPPLRSSRLGPFHSVFRSAHAPITCSLIRRAYLSWSSVYFFLAHVAHFAHRLALSRPKFPKRCRLLTCACVPNLIRIGWGLSQLSRKTDVSYIRARSFQLTVISITR